MSNYVVDASVVVKWLNQEREAATRQALTLLERAMQGEDELMSVDLLVYEVLNALIKGNRLRGRLLEEAVEVFFRLPLGLHNCDISLVSTAAIIAEQHQMTFYDAVYVALAYREQVPLLTANPKDQGKVPGLMVIDIADWSS